MVANLRTRLANRVGVFGACGLMSHRGLLNTKQRLSHINREREREMVSDGTARHGNFI